MAGVCVVWAWGVCFPRHRQVTGMNEDAAEAYNIGAFCGAWRAGKSSGDEEGCSGRVVIGGALVKRTDFAAVVAGVVGAGAGYLERKYLKKLSDDSGNPSQVGKF